MAEVALQIKAAGRWKEYIDRRAELERQGFTKRDAVCQAVDELTPYLVQVADTPAPAPAAEKRKPGRPSKDPNSPRYKAPEAKTEVPESPQPSTQPLTPPQTGSAPPAVAPQIRTRLKSEFEMNFASKKTWEGKPPISEIEMVRWVFDNLAIEDVKPEDAPSAGAWAMLIDCRTSADARSKFMNGLWPKLLPKGRGDDAEDPLADDGEGVLEFIQKVREVSLGGKPA